MNTEYKIVYQIANRVRMMQIEAATPLEAFKRFKELMPKIMFDNLAINDIVIDMPKPKTYIKKSEPKLCFPCANTFDKILKQAV